MKECDICGCYKPASEVFTNKRKTNKCNDCIEKAKAIKREKGRLEKQRYRKEHSEHYKEVMKLYNEKNKEKLKQYDQDRMLNRPEYFFILKR